MSQMLVGGTTVNGAMASDTVAHDRAGNRLRITGGAGLTMAIARDRMTLQAKPRLRNSQKLADGRPMRIVTVGAGLDDRRMLEHERSAYCLMASGATLSRVGQRGLASGVWIVTASAGDATFWNRVVRRHVETGDHVLVAGCAKRCRFAPLLLTQTDQFDLGLVDAVTIRALDTCAVVLGECKCGALLVLDMASQTLLGLRFADLGFPRTFGGRMCERTFMATGAVAVVDMRLGLGIMTIGTLSTRDRFVRSHAGACDCGSCK